MNIYARLFISITALLWSGFIFASDMPNTADINTSYQQALTAYNQGNFKSALTVLTQTVDADLTAQERLQKHIMAAEILAARVMLGQSKAPKTTAQKARDHAKLATDIQPEHQYAQLQYIVADGLVTRMTSPFKVWRKKLSSKMLDKIEAYNIAYSDDPRGQALLAAWHFGVIEKAGIKNGKKWFGASQDKGIELYETALKNAPDDTLLATHYFFALASICSHDAANMDARLISLSQQIKQMPASTALDRGMVEFVAELTPLIGQHKDLEKSARAILSGRPT